jgi:putative lipoprotein
MKRKLLSLTLLTIMLFSACSAFSAGDPLDGSSWELSALRGNRPVEGSTVSIEFKAGQLGGSGGCNSYGGSYEVDGDQIQVQELVSTLMACADQPVTDQESVYLQYLGDARRFELTDGQLQLFRSDGEALVFVPAR